MSHSFDSYTSDSKKRCYLSPTKRLHNNFLEALDSMESKVENMRDKVSTVEVEREELIRNLGRLKINKELKRFTEREREEIEATAQRLMNRALTVEVNIITSRTEVQKKALTKVNKLVDDLLDASKWNGVNSKHKLEQYLNACQSESIGPVDIPFQTLVLDCAVDDQKRIRKRLQCIVNNSTFPMDID